MKKIIIDGLIIIIGFILSGYIMKLCLVILDRYNIISDSARLSVLLIPFFIYGVVLFGIVPYIISKVNTKFFNRKKEVK